MSAVPTSIRQGAQRTALLRGAWLWTCYIVLDTGSQLAFKWAADSLGSGALTLRWLLHAIALPGTLVGVACYVGTLLAWMRILHRMDLSRAFPLSGVSYITVPSLAVILFNETITSVQALGICVICSGVAILALHKE